MSLAITQWLPCALSWDSAVTADCDRDDSDIDIDNDKTDIDKTDIDSDSDTVYFMCR